MAVPIDTIIEVRPTVGSDTLCGGGFSNANKGATGVDYTQQSSAQYTYTSDLSGSGSTTLTSAGAHFTNDILGNVIQITGQGLYCVTAFSSSSAVTVDRALGTFSSGTGYVGGAFNSIGEAGALLALITGTTTSTNYPIIYIKSTGTGLWVGGQNTSGGRLSLTVNFTWVVGYTSTRTQLNTDSKPTIQPNTTSVTGIYVPNAGCLIRNINFANGSNQASCVGIQIDSLGTVLLDSTFGGFATCISVTGSGAIVQNCEVNGLASGSSFGINVTSAGSSIIGCSVHDWTSTSAIGIQAVNNDCCLMHNIVYNGKNIGYKLQARITAGHNIAYNITSGDGSGFEIPGGFASAYGTFLFNNIASTCGAYGFNITGAGNTDVSFRMANNADYNCTTAGVRSNAVTNYNVFNQQSLSVDPFTSASGGDFSLNSTAGGGATLKAAGFPNGTIGNLSITNHLDIGAIQSSGSGGGGGGLLNLGTRGGFSD